MEMPELSLAEDPDSAITALRFIRAKMATPEGIADEFTILALSGNPELPPEVHALIHALADIARGVLLGCADLTGRSTDDEARQWVLDYLSSSIDAVTLQALGAEPGPGPE